MLPPRCNLNLTKMVSHLSLLPVSKDFFRFVHCQCCYALLWKKKQTSCGVAYKNRTDEPRQMTWSRFSIKLLEVHFCDSAHDCRNWGKIYIWQFNKENSHLEQNTTPFERKKITVNQMLWSKLWYKGQLYKYIPKCIWKKLWKV